MTKLSRLFWMLALAAGLCLLQPTLNAQQDPVSNSQAAQQQQPPDTSSQTPAMNQASDSQTFAGKIAKSGGKLVLKDSTSQSTYALDDQDKAKQFEGQKVKITGTLDEQSKTIRITSIAPES
jgi:uncharacterized protein YdeI (BOF family)